MVMTLIEAVRYMGSTIGSMPWLLGRAVRRSRATRSVLTALGLCLAAPALHAACVPDGAAAVDLLLPPAQLAVSSNTPVGTVLSTLNVSPGKDIDFRCSGADNSQDLRVLTPAVAVPGVPFVYATGVPGVGVRVTTRSGNFAGIDDGPRVAPSVVKLPPHAATLAGLLIQFDFIKTGPVQSGTAAPGKWVSLTVGGTELVSVSVPPGSVMVAAQDCSAVNVGGAVTMGVGTGGAFNQESVVVSTGCEVGLEAVISTGNRYVYGAPPIVAPARVEHTPEIGVGVSRGFALLDQHGATRSGLRSSKSDSSEDAVRADDSFNVSGGAATGTAPINATPGSVSTTGGYVGFRH